jgi:hypothetical protein
VAQPGRFGWFDLLAGTQRLNPARALSSSAVWPADQNQVRGGLVERQLAGHEVGEDDDALLCPSIQGDLPRFHGIEGDKIAVPLARTESLSSDRSHRRV